MTLRPSIDMETYSEAGFYLDADGKIKGSAPSGKGGLPVVGTPQYACHPSTEILCMSYDMHDWYGLARGWVLGTPSPTDLLQHVAAGGEIEAHNVTFEWWIWNMVGVRKYGWPPLQIEQCYCSMAKSRRYSLPGALAKVTAVLGTPGKSPDGTRLIQKLSRPHTPTKNRPEIRWTPATAWDDFRALYKYCDQDVYAEDGISALIPDLTPEEREVWLVDQYTNVRGVQVDTVTLTAALAVLEQAETKYNAELSSLTGGVVSAASETAKLGAWVGTQGVCMPNMQKQTVVGMIEAGLTVNDPKRAGALRALQIRQILGSANVKKLHTLKLQTSSDGRLRDQYMYCGADRTARWSAGGVQLQNMTAKGPKVCKCDECGEYLGNAIWKRFGACPRCGQWAGGHDPSEWGPEAVQAAIQDIRTGDLTTVERYWGDSPLDVLCGCLRGMLVAKPGHDFIYVDFSAIEAVIAACISRCQWRIEVFNTHGKIYEQSAANATGIPFEEILAHRTEHGTHHPARAKSGKVRELAGAYGGWVNAWRNFGANESMTDEEIKDDVIKWRAESPEIVEAWGGQYRWCGPGKWDYTPELYGFEGAAIMAILNPGKCFSHIDITYGVKDDILHCRLPSGRFLYYHKPRLAVVQDKRGIGDCYQITFEGYNSNAMKGPIGWHRMETWGAKFFEHVCQGIGRDFQARALVRCDRSGYAPVMHTHDDITAEVPERWGSVEEMIAIVTERLEWASWWPIRADGWRAKRYQK